MTFTFQQIDPQTFTGQIPPNSNLVIAEEGNVLKTAAILWDFSETYLFVDEYENPIWGILTDTEPLN